MFTVQIKLDGEWVPTDCTGDKAKCDAEARSWSMLYAADEIRVVSGARSLAAALNELGVLPRAKPAPKPKPATGPIRVVTGEPDF